MIEAGVLIDLTNKPIYWHAPIDRGTTILPDSSSLWDHIWANKDRVLGFAHTHPGAGMPAPSYMDMTTFIAIEQALGRPLSWWIASSDKLGLFRLREEGSYPILIGGVVTPEPEWVHELRQISNF